MYSTGCQHTSQYIYVRKRRKAAEKSSLAPHYSVNLPRVNPASVKTRMKSSAIVTISLLAFALAHPLEKRGGLSANDTNTLQLALYLEHLEFVLYSSGYANFSEAQYESAGFPLGFRDNVNVIAQVLLPRLLDERPC